MDEALKQIKQIVDDLASVVYNHRHLGYDLTTPLNLPSAGSIGKPAGNTTEVQFNDNGAFGSSTNFTFDKSAGGNVNIQPNNGGGQLALSGATGAAGSGNGGSAVLTGGDPDFGNSATGAGGAVQIYPGSSNDNSKGGSLSLIGGDGSINGVGTGDGGDISLTGGSKGSGGTNNGKIILESGFATQAQSYTPSIGGTATLDLALANEHRIQMPAGNITIALATDTDAQKFLVSITQDSGGSRTVTWFTTIRWAGGVAPTLTTTATKRDTFGFIRTGSGTYDGFIVGQAI